MSPKRECFGSTLTTTFNVSIICRISHSCSRNCVKEGNSVIALRDIKANEEITISYGTGAEDNSWEERRDWLKMKYKLRTLAGWGFCCCCCC